MPWSFTSRGIVICTPWLFGFVCVMEEVSAGCLFSHLGLLPMYFLIFSVRVLSITDSWSDKYSTIIVEVAMPLPFSEFCFICFGALLFSACAFLIVIFSWSLWKKQSLFLCLFLDKIKCDYSLKFYYVLLCFTLALFIFLSFYFVQFGLLNLKFDSMAII